MKIVTVVPLKKGLWREDLTYFSGKDIPNGSIVTVPLRSKKVLGLVIDSTDASASKSDIKKMSFNLKKIIEVKENSIFLKEYLIATIEISKYFASSKNNGVTTLIPAILRENYDKVSKTINGEKINLGEYHKMIVVRDGEVNEIFAKDILITDKFLVKKNHI